MTGNVPLWHTIGMRIHRFFIEQTLPSHGPVQIEDVDVVHQWRNVLRFQVGQEVILFDNTGLEVRGVIESITNRVAQVNILESKDRSIRSAGVGSGLENSGQHGKPAIYLYLALAKRDSFEWALEKGTELGVSGFVPVVSERSEKKTVRIDRSQNILKEASEQSGRVTVPTISEPFTLNEALQDVTKQSSVPDQNGSSRAFSFVLDPRGNVFEMGEVKKEIEEICGSQTQRVNIFIGPEGGFSPAEIGLFKQYRIPVYTFGEQVLRAETAAVAAASIFLLDF
jgi:16S rRNA (uracil1498-N3)-methyltransferase